MIRRPIAGPIDDDGVCIYCGCKQVDRDAILREEGREEERVRWLRHIGRLRAQAIEAAAKTCDDYGREGDRLAKAYATETADELAARIRQLVAPVDLADLARNDQGPRRGGGDDT